jgi:hypothetical protein
MVTRTIEKTIPMIVAINRSRSLNRFRQESLKINDIIFVPLHRNFGARVSQQDATALA